MMLFFYQCLSYIGNPSTLVESPLFFAANMNSTRKTRIPSVPYLEMKIAELGAIAKPKPEEIQLLAHYQKLIDQRMQNENYSGILEMVC